ncbi:AAA family ATPase, partial [bacterium]|nr:AAA family ATPase [bacterium]
SHQQAVEASRVCIDRRNGPVVLIGSVGAGKSLTMQVIGEEHKDRFDVVSIECSRLEQRSELLQSILFGLDLPFREMSEGELRLSLIEHLKGGKGSSEGMLLMVDEADRLSIELLDELRLITNIVRDGRSQVQLVLAGTQRLEESLNDPRLASFNQRVASRNFLQNLSRTEVAQYIAEHLDRAGGDAESVFDTCAIDEVARCTDGCPRLINQVCEIALTEAADYSLSSIDEHLVQQAWAQLQNLPVPSRRPAATEASGQSCGSGSESVVEFGSLSDDRDFDSSYSVGGDTDEESFDSQASNDASQESDEAYEAVSQSSDFHSSDFVGSNQVDEDEPALETGADNDEEVDETEVESSSTETVAEDSTSDEPQQDSDPSDEWSGRLPTNLGINDFRTAFDAQSVGYSMSPMGSGGDPFAPESSTTDVNAQVFQDSRETGNLDEAQDYSYGQSFSSSSHVSEDSEAEAADSRIEALQQEQRELVEQVDSVNYQSDSLKSYSDSDEGPAKNSTTQDDVEAAFRGLQQIDQARSAELTQDPEVPVEAAVDPFEEDFEEEVLLQDTYSPFVAKQNQSSLTVTSENLSHLSPRDEDSDAAQPETGQATQADGVGSASYANGGAEDESPMTNLPSGFSFPTPPADASFVPVQSVPTELDLGDVEAEVELLQNVSSGAESDSAGHDDLIDPDLAALTSDFPFEDESHQTASEQVAQPFGHDESDRVAQEIKLETEEIVQELRSSIESDVSRESVEPPAIEAFVSETQNQPSQEGREPFNQESFFQSAATSDQSNDEPQLDSNQQILRDILDQQKLINDQQQANAFDSSDQNSSKVDSISVEYPITDHQNYQAPSDVSNDDRDMLRVSESQYNQPRNEASDERSPLADATPSTGEAQRMDYGQLFDQLRNLPKE